MLLLKCCTHYTNIFGKLSLTTRLEKVYFHFNTKERQCQRMFKLAYNYTHFTCQQDFAQNSPSYASENSCVKPRQCFKKHRHHCADKGLCSHPYMTHPVIMYGCESWTIKKAEDQRIDAFKLWCWWRLLRVLWTARKSDQSILQEINPEYSVRVLMLKLKF